MIANNKSAFLLMLISVILYSFVPPLLKILNAAEAPFLFNTIITLASVSVYIVFLSIFANRALFNLSVIKKIFRNSHIKLILLCAIGSLDYAFYTLSINYLDIAIATILFDSSTLFLIMIIVFLFKSEKKYCKIDFTTLMLIAFTFIGFVLVVLSGEPNLDIAKISISFSILIGAGIALIGALLTAYPAAYTLKWGFNMNKLLKYEKDTVKDKKEELFFVLISLIIIKIVGGLLSLGIGITAEETINISSALIIFVSAIIFTGVAGILFSYANIITTNPAINILFYLTTVFSLIWLHLLSFINVPHTNLFLLGAIIVIATNVIMYLRFKVGVCRIS